MRLGTVAQVVAIVAATRPEFAGAAPGGPPTFLHEAQFHGRGEAYGRPNTSLGAAAAVSGDTLLAGAPSEDSSSKSAGVAYVFERSGTTWSERQRLRASDGTEFDRFGTAVAIEGDTAVVGAPGHETPAGFAGAVYVFVRSGGVWTEQQQLISPDGVSNDQFGSAVAIEGDTLVIGAPSMYSGPVDPGSAYVFVRSGTTWAWQQTLVPATPGGGDAFGAAVAISGDTVAVTAPLDDTPAGMDAGSAHVFVRSGTAWTRQQELRAPDATGYGGFGTSVAVSGETLAVGAYTVFSAPVPATGGVYVFDRAGSAWSLQQTLHAADQAAGDGFGGSVALGGSRLIVGAVAADAGGVPDVGAVYVFGRPSGTWIEQQKLTAAQGETYDQLGAAVSFSGDTIVAGAPGDDRPGRRDDAGTAVVFVGAGGPFTEQQRVVGPDGPGGDLLGYAVSLSGDTLVTGAPQDGAETGLYAGSAYVHVRSPGGWTEQQKLRASDAAERDLFGYAVSIAGDTALVGTRVDAFSARPGAAYAFHRANGAWSEEAKLLAPDGHERDNFGAVVAVWGDTAVVGAPGAHTASLYTGAVYVFVRAGSTWTLQQKVAASDAATDDNFGASLAIEGDTLVVGAPMDVTSGGKRTGSAYVFVRSGTSWTQEQKLAVPDPGILDTFGASVTLSGNTTVVGAPGEYDASLGLGTAYVFVRSGATWTQQQKLGPMDGVTVQFGRALSLSGDVVVAGSDPSNGGGPGGLPGAVHVFVREGTSWTQQPKLQAPDGVAGDQFGFRVALSGDTVAAGAYRDTIEGEAYAGSVHVYRAESADLAVTVTDGQATAAPGETLAYTIVASSQGPQAIAGATVTNPLPAALTNATWTCVASPGSTCAANGSGSISDGVTLAPGGTATYVVTATVSPGATGALTNTAAIAPAPTVFDANPANNSATDVDALVPRTDLGVALDASADHVSPGDLLRYTASVGNAGPSNATGVSLVETLPPGVAFVASSPGSPTCVLAGRELTCALGAMTAGADATVTVDVTIGAPPGRVLVARAVVAGPRGDPNTSNDAVSIATIVRGAAGELAPGSTAFLDLAARPGPDQDRFLVGQKPYSSYEVIVDATSGDVGAGAGPALERIGADGTTVLQTARPVGTGPSRSLRFRNTTSADVLDEAIRVQSASCSTDCGADDVYRIRAYDTTYSIARFNNSGSQLTFLVLQNRTAEPVTGDVYLHAPSGATIAAHSFSLEAHAVLVLNTTTLPGAAGASGSIVVSHDGGYGSLSGKSVSLDPGTGFSFDAPLEPRPR